jgi:hypothetical protein
MSCGAVTAGNVANSENSIMKYESQKTLRGNVGVSYTSQQVADDQANKMDESNCRDCTYCINCKDCINCINCKGCIDCINCEDCTDCTYCAGCIDCIYCTGCIDCAGCTGCIGCADSNDHITALA